MMRSRQALALLVVLGSLPACGSDDEPFKTTTQGSLEDPANLRVWANTASALGVYANVYSPFAIADGEETPSDPLCPTLEDDGTTLTVTGGCTDESGVEVLGDFSVERRPNTNELSLNDYGTKRPGEAANTLRGTASLERIDDALHEFSLSVTRTSGIVTTYDYAGSVKGTYGERTVWNGSGTVSRDGLAAPTGSVDVSTSEEVLDSEVCNGQPISGTTTIQDDAGKTAVITYDGSVECDSEQAASYSLGGKPQGKISGISCAASPGEAGARGPAWPWVLAFAVGLVGVRQRKRRPTERGGG